MSTLPEPWLRGPLTGIHPLLAPVFYAFQHAREDLRQATEGLDPARLWERPHGLTPVGFHLRHIAGSVDRLTTYLQGLPLTAAQLSELDQESQPGADRGELLDTVDRAFTRAEQVFRAIDPATLPDARTVGRRHLPTTVIGLLTHIAEHTLRHVGEVVVTAKLLK